jgi:hypothetical protein
MNGAHKVRLTPLVSVALSRRPAVYGRDRQVGALFNFAQFVEILDRMEVGVQPAFPA